MLFRAAWLALCLLSSLYGAPAQVPRVFVIGEGLSIRYGPALALKLVTQSACDRMHEEPGAETNAFGLQSGPEDHVDHVHYREPLLEEQAAFVADALSQLVASVPPDFESSLSHE